MQSCKTLGAFWFKIVNTFTITHTFPFAYSICYYTRLINYGQA